MEYFLVRYASRVVIYERKTFIRLATGVKFVPDEFARASITQNTSANLSPVTNLINVL